MTTQRLRGEAIVAAGGGIGNGRFGLCGLVGSSKGIDKLDVEGLDGAERAGVGLPVEVSERKTGDQARREELVDIVGVEILDWRAAVRCVSAIAAKARTRRRRRKRKRVTCHFGGGEGLFHGEQQAENYGARSMTGWRACTHYEGGLALGLGRQWLRGGGVVMWCRRGRNALRLSIGRSVGRSVGVGPPEAKWVGYSRAGYPTCPPAPRPAQQSKL